MVRHATERSLLLIDGKKFVEVPLFSDFCRVRKGNKSSRRHSVTLWDSKAYCGKGRVSKSVSDNTFLWGYWISSRLPPQLGIFSIRFYGIIVLSSFVLTNYRLKTILPMRLSSCIGNLVLTIWNWIFDRVIGGVSRASYGHHCAVAAGIPIEISMPSTC